MKIYRPTKTNLLCQLFGKENTFASMLPLYNSLGLEGHNGFDFSVLCKDNQVIHGGQCEQVYINVVGADLTVLSFQKDDKAGFGINAIDENGNKYCWWHFDILDPAIVIGAKLTAGQVLGVAGNTGMSKGAHVHFGYYPALANKNNGYGGAEDPTPFYDNRFILDIEKQIGIIKSLIEALKSLVLLLNKKL